MEHWKGMVQELQLYNFVVGKICSQGNEESTDL